MMSLVDVALVSLSRSLLSNNVHRTLMSSLWVRLNKYATDQRHYAYCYITTKKAKVDGEYYRLTEEQTECRQTYTYTHTGEQGYIDILESDAMEPCRNSAET